LGVLHVALIGDYDRTAVAHQAIPPALVLAGKAVGVGVDAEWVATDTIDSAARSLSHFDGIWCVPVTPYRSAAGAIAAVRFARTGGVPFLGTCGGFQHMVLEVAESLWRIAGPAHAELSPGASDPIIAPLACALVERRGRVRFAEGSKLAAAYGLLEAEEEYHCSYGLSARCRPFLDEGPLRATSWDGEGDVRGAELDGHPFFVGTLFQSERRALRGEVAPIVRAFVAAAAARDA
jgi:CTP synthase (UTP-ammonia lyase)